MNSTVTATINAAIALEYALSKLYEYYCERFPEQRNFWNELMIEEINHASLLKTVKDFSKIDYLPKGLFMKNVRAYHKTIKTIKESMNIERIPDLNAACEFAYSMEKSSGEMHFQEALSKNDPDVVTKIFIQLNGRDLNHASRILKYWQASVMEQE